MLAIISQSSAYFFSFCHDLIHTKSDDIKQVFTNKFIHQEVLGTDLFSLVM